MESGSVIPSKVHHHVTTLDTSTPSGRAMFQMMGVFAEFERAIIRERVRAGIERAKASGTKSGRRFGRPALKDGSKGIAKIAAIEAELAAGKGIRRIARDLGAGVGTVLRVKGEMAA
jgi:DNA invertase Pin-like site-specific DNA recombinase